MLVARVAQPRPARRGHQRVGGDEGDSQSAQPRRERVAVAFVLRPAAVEKDDQETGPQRTRLRLHRGERLRRGLRIGAGVGCRTVSLAGRCAHSLTSWDNILKNSSISPTARRMR